MSENVKHVPSDKEIEYSLATDAIIKNAGDFHLTYQQALSIYLRSLQLKDESDQINASSENRKRSQIEKCYSQKYLR